MITSDRFWNIVMIDRYLKRNNDYIMGYKSYRIVDYYEQNYLCRIVRDLLSLLVALSLGNIMIFFKNITQLVFAHSFTITRINRMNLNSFKWN